MEPNCVKPDFPGELSTPWCGDDLDQMENFPFFNNTATIDFPFIATNVPPVVNPPEANDYIDVKSLVIPNCFRPAQMDGKAVPPEAGRKEDVEFVREYKQRRSKTKSAKEERPPPRRNPKRQARAHAKQSDVPALEADHRGGREGALKRTTRTTTEAAYRDWPVEGMHEKPNFNPVTKRLEKLPGLPAGTRRARRFRRLQADGKPSGDEERHDTRQFAALAHCNLHYALLYVDNVKKRNAASNATGDSPANVSQARDLLRDACTMYCVAHDVAEESLARYLDTVTAQEDLPTYLRSVLDGH